MSTPQLVKMRMQDKLVNNNNAVDVAGSADFVFCNGDDRVCVIETKNPFQVVPSENDLQRG
jgi:hypothetical protein